MSRLEEFICLKLSSSDESDDVDCRKHKSRHKMRENGTPNRSSGVEIKDIIQSPEIVCCSVSDPIEIVISDDDDEDVPAKTIQTSSKLISLSSLLQNNENGDVSINTESDFQSEREMKTVINTWRVESNRKVEGSVYRECMEIFEKKSQFMMLNFEPVYIVRVVEIPTRMDDNNFFKLRIVHSRDIEVLSFKLLPRFLNESMIFIHSYGGAQQQNSAYPETFLFCECEYYACYYRRVHSSHLGTQRVKIEKAYNSSVVCLNFIDLGIHQTYVNPTLYFCPKMFASTPNLYYDVRVGGLDQFSDQLKEVKNLARLAKILLSPSDGVRKDWRAKFLKCTCEPQCFSESLCRKLSVNLVEWSSCLSLVKVASSVLSNDQPCFSAPNSTVDTSLPQSIQSSCNRPVLLKGSPLLSHDKIRITAFTDWSDMYYCQFFQQHSKFKGLEKLLNDASKSDVMVHVKDVTEINKGTAYFYKDLDYGILQRCVVKLDNCNSQSNESGLGLDDLNLEECEAESEESSSVKVDFVDTGEKIEVKSSLLLKCLYELNVNSKHHARVFKELRSFPSRFAHKFKMWHYRHAMWSNRVVREQKSQILKLLKTDNDEFGWIESDLMLSQNFYNSTQNDTLVLYLRNASSHRMNSVKSHLTSCLHVDLSFPTDSASISEFRNKTEFESACLEVNSTVSCVITSDGSRVTSDSFYIVKTHELQLLDVINAAGRRAFGSDSSNCKSPPPSSPSFRPQLDTCVLVRSVSTSSQSPSKNVVQYVYKRGWIVDILHSGATVFCFDIGISESDISLKDLLPLTSAVDFVRPLAFKCQWIERSMRDNHCDLSKQQLDLKVIRVLDGCNFVDLVKCTDDIIVID